VNKEPIVASNQGGDFEKAPTGLQQAVCVFVHDLGYQVGQWAGEEKIQRKVIITWELAEKQTNGERFTLSKFYTLSLHEKANLRKDLESWRGKPFSEDELKGVDLQELIGANCFLNVTPTDKDKRKISAIAPIPRGTVQIKPIITEPSENFQKWITGFRDKAVSPVAQTVHEPDDGKDGLPF
jgi:hypothetical protein